MANIRILYDNAIDRASLSASSSAGALVVTNLQNDFKGQVWRATSNSATLAAVWAAPEKVGCVALPFCNLTAAATIRVRGYTNAADTVPAFDTGLRPACAFVPTDLYGFRGAAVNGYSFGAGAYAVAWFAPQMVTQLIVDIVDTSLPYVEASRLVAGKYWSPEKNVDYGATTGMMDASVHSRNDSGDLVTVRGKRHRTLTVNFTILTPADRAAVNAILRGNGLPKPLFVSLSPESTDGELEQSGQLYGKLSTLSNVAFSFFNNYATGMTFEEF